VTGALLGVAGLLFLSLAAVRVPAWRGNGGLPVAGLALVVPLAAVRIEGELLPTEVLAGLALLLVAGLWRPREPTVAGRIVSSVPGAALLALGSDGVAVVVVLVAVPVLTAALTIFESGHDYEHGLAPMCAAIAGGGAFLTVPDTEHVALIAGAGVVVGLAVVIAPRLALGMSGPLWAGAFVWAVAIDGTGRAAAVVGALGALGLLIIDPAVRSNVRIHRGLLTYLPVRGPRSQVLATAAIQTALAVFTARVAGLRTDVQMAVVLTVVAWMVVGIGLGQRARSLT